MSRSWAGGSTYRWRRTREQVLLDNIASNQGRCVLAVPNVCTGPAREVHHTKGRAVTGDDPRHLVAVCKACNLHVGDPSAARHDPPPRPTSNW